MKELKEAPTKTKKERNDTTVSISKSTRARIDRKAKEFGITTTTFVEASANYFIRYGLNPINESSEKDVLLEVHKLREDLFRFLRKQEYEEIAPTLQQVQRMNDQLIKHNNTLVKMVGVLKGVPFDLYNIVSFQNAILTALYLLNNIETDQEVRAIAQRVNMSYEQAIKDFTQSGKG